MKKRSRFTVVTKLIGLVKPLTAYMALAVIMGIVGHLCASFITIFGGFAVLDLVGVNVPFSLTIIFISLAIFSVLRAALRYAEQACNHFIAFKLLALIRDKVFQALRKLCPAKLESKDKGDLISVITSDIELLEVFYAHTISPVLIFLSWIRPCPATTINCSHLLLCQCCPLVISGLLILMDTCPQFKVCISSVKDPRSSPFIFNRYLNLSVGR